MHCGLSRTALQDSDRLTHVFVWYCFPRPRHTTTNNSLPGGFGFLSDSDNSDADDESSDHESSNSEQDGEEESERCDSEEEKEQAEEDKNQEKEEAKRRESSFDEEDKEGAAKAELLPSRTDSDGPSRTDSDGETEEVRVESPKTSTDFGPSSTDLEVFGSSCTDFGTAAESEEERKVGCCRRDVFS